MRKFILAAALALPLAACQTASSGSTVVDAAIGALPTQVQETAVKVCGFLPAAETVAQLIAAFGGPTVPGIVGQIAAEICDAVTKPRTGAIRGTRPHGVLIRGQ